MNLTRGERWALLCYAVVVLGFIPGVWVASAVKATVLGFPFPLFWAALMVVTTAVMMTVAFAVKDRIDGRRIGGTGTDGRRMDGKRTDGAGIDGTGRDNDRVKGEGEVEGQVKGDVEGQAKGEVEGQGKREGSHPVGP